MDKPYYYCDNGKRKNIYIKNENNEFTGEDDILIEKMGGSL